MNSHTYIYIYVLYIYMYVFIYEHVWYVPYVLVRALVSQSQGSYVLNAWVSGAKQLAASTALDSHRSLWSGVQDKARRMAEPRDTLRLPTSCTCEPLHNPPHHHIGS